MKWAWGLVACAGCVSAPASLVPGLERPASMVRGKSELVLRCVPADAEVLLDRVPQGTCQDFSGQPRALAVGRGARHVTVQKRGYQGWDSVVEGDGTRMAVDISLVSNGGSSP